MGEEKCWAPATSALSCGRRESPTPACPLLGRATDGAVWRSRDRGGGPRKDWDPIAQWQRASLPSLTPALLSPALPQPYWPPVPSSCFYSGHYVQLSGKYLQNCKRQKLFEILKFHSENVIRYLKYDSRLPAHALWDLDVIGKTHKNIFICLNEGVKHMCICNWT